MRRVCVWTHTHTHAHTQKSDYLFIDLPPRGARHLTIIISSAGRRHSVSLFPSPLSKQNTRVRACAYVHYISYTQSRKDKRVHDQRLIVVGGRQSQNELRYRRRSPFVHVRYSRTVDFHGRVRVLNRIRTQLSRTRWTVTLLIKLT